jgi:TPR repeat protein
MIYDIGLGVPKDYAEAAKWFSKAAAQGDADAKEWLEKNGKEEGE